MNLIEMSARSLRDAVSNRTVSAREVLEAHLRQHDAVEPDIRATVEVDNTAITETARLIDEQLARGHADDLGPLAGLPIGIKDIFDVRGWPTRLGAKAYAAEQPSLTDSVLVGEIRRSGGVIAAKTACHELACGVYTPGVANPWDLDRSAGGSSGGSAAAVAAGSLALATGSDTGGSIRIPAALCGLVGFKPTYGLLSTTGVRPLSWSLDHVGPIGKTVDCTRLFMEATVNDWPRRTKSVRRRGNLRVLPPRVGCLLGGEFGSVHPEVERHFAKTVESLSSVMEFEQVTLPLVERSVPLAFSIILPEMAAEYGNLLMDENSGLSDEIRQTVLGGLLLPGYVYVRAQAERRRLTRSVGRLMQERGLDAIICPTVPNAAQRHSQSSFDFGGVEEEGVQEAFVRTTAPWNLTGQPSVAVPMGITTEGLPTSVQIVGRTGADAEVLDIAELLEEARGTTLVPGLPPQFRKAV